MKWCVVLALAGCGRDHFDARADGGGDASAATPFCASLAVQPTFCSDFADGTTAVWNATPSMFNGAFAVGIGQGPTPDENALVVTTQTIGTGEESDVHLETSFGSATMTSARAEFDIIIDTVASSQPVFALTLFDDGTQTHAIEPVYVKPPPQAYAEEAVTPNGGSTTFYSYNFPSFESGVWHRFRYDMTTGTNPTLVTYLDGAMTSTSTLVVTSGGTLAFRIGVVFIAGPTAPWQLRFANVAVYAQ